MHWRVVIITIFGAPLTQYVSTQDICTKFNIGGPCDLLQPPINNGFRVFAIAPLGNPYCRLACTQGNSSLFSDVCQCANAGMEDNSDRFPAATSTLSPLPSAARNGSIRPSPVTCFYTSQRPARTYSIFRRMFSSRSVTTECDYPGVVSLFREEHGQLVLSCLASLLEEDVVLINGISCLNLIQNYTVYVMADSYKVSNATKAISVNPETLTKLDNNGSASTLYTARLSSNLTLDNRCIQPVCVPNINIPASDIDFDDCRIVGYGSDPETPLPESPQLDEVHVRVDPLSITDSNLTVTRVDGPAGPSCLNLDSGPLICTHKTTGEWVTVGVSDAALFPCSKPDSNQKPLVTSLLREAWNVTYNDDIQKFKYADPDVFTAYINSTNTY